MPPTFYRLCFTNTDTGRTHFYVEFEAADDAAAIRSVEGRPAEVGAELWCGDRLVPLPRRDDEAGAVAAGED